MPFPFIKSPSNTLHEWNEWLSISSWPRNGLRTYLQQPLAHPPLKIGKPSVFLVFSGKEIGIDSALFGIDVYNVPPPVYTLIAGVNVTINEIQSTKSAAASITEE
jgi:hypothetical protein